MKPNNNAYYSQVSCKVGYVGGSTVEEGDGVNKTNYFGFNFGANVIRTIGGFNLIVALGAESAFKSKENKFNPYLGIGAGINLVDLYEPKNTKE